jgi:hypothetical protein
VIDDVDGTLRAFLADALPEKTAVDFDAPTAEWSGKVEMPTVNLFLRDVSEERQARAGDWTDVRDENGNVTARQPPVRHFTLVYHVTAWGGSTAEQHALLGAVVAGLPVYDSIPTQYLSGRLADDDVSVGLQVGENGSSADLWALLGQHPRASLTLVVTVPVAPPAVTELEPPPSSIDLGLAGADGRSGRSPAATLPDPPGSTPPRPRPEPSAAGDRDGGTDGTQLGNGGQEGGWTTFRVREHISSSEH